MAGMPDPRDPRFAYQGGGPLLGDSGLPMPQNHMGGVAFWYRPDTSMPLIDRHNSMGGAITGIEAVKHRRTRSGCFTCRSRRVKCDETRPMCDRCRKGNRECEFPKPTGSKSTNRVKSARRQQFGDDSDPSDAEGEIDESSVLETIKDEDEADDEDARHEVDTTTNPIPSRSKPPRKYSLQTASRKQKHKHQMENLHARKEKATSPGSDSSASSMSGTQTPASSLPTSARNTPPSRSRWADQRKDIQKYLDYHRNHMSNYHYIVKYDARDFFHNELIDQALTYEPLLYAVVAFSAYYYTLGEQKGKLSNFLSYYSRSLQLLGKSLKMGERKPATLLTILQLATFEEHLGDWPTLVGHQRASHAMLKELYTVETIMQTELSRQTLSWYSRFDLMVGLISGGEAVAPREWYAHCEEFYEAQIDPDELDLDNNFYAFNACNRLIALDLAALFSKLARGQISPQEFSVENDKLGQRHKRLQERIQELNDGYYTVEDFPDKKPLTPADIVDPYVPGGLFRDALFPLNFSWVDWYGLDMMRRYQTAIILRQEIPSDLVSSALELCRIYEAMERWPQSPKAGVLGSIAGLGLAIVFLPKDQRHTMWCRTKLAEIERQGYVYPAALRKKMADSWQSPETNQWWLPNNEGFTPLLRDIRAFIKERADAYDASQGDELRDDLRDMKAIFSKLDIDESPKSPPSSEGAASHATP